MNYFNMSLKELHSLPLKRSIWTVLLLQLLLSSCASSDYAAARRRQLGTFPPIDNSVQAPSSATIEERDLSLTQDHTQTELAPWLFWRKGQTLKNIEFKDSRVKLADVLAAEGNYAEALKSYRLARPLGSDEAESLALRISSLELLSADAPKSILSLSRFFQGRKLGETQVSDDAALFFGFAYGQSRNYEQAFAWLHQALTSKQSHIQDQARNAVKLLLRIIPSSSLEEIALVWKFNDNISKLISEERFIRQNRPTVVLDKSTFFWLPSGSNLDQQSNPSALNGSENSISHQQNSRKVVALLPLSGRFAKMGAAVKSGLELAAELSLTRGNTFEVSFKDLPSNSGNVETESSITSSPDAVVEEAVSTGASLIVGPLISEQAFEVEESARRNSIPTVLLAKGGKASLGEGVYRFGLTNESQAESLISSILKFRQNPRIALVYPNDEAGLGFINAVKEVLQGNNISALYDLSYNKGDNAAMLAKIPELEGNPAEFVIFGDNLKAATQFFAAFSSRTRKSIIPVGSALWDNPIEVMQSKTILSGAIFVSAFYPDLSRPLISEFIARFKEKNKRTPDFFAAQGYDVGLLISASPNYSNDTYAPPSSIEGVSGQINTRSHGEISRELTVLHVSRGTIAPLSELANVRVSSETQIENDINDFGDDSKNLQNQQLSDPVVSE